MFAFLCDTPYQIFNCVNFVYHDLENSKNNADLYVVTQFADAERIIQAVRKTGLFKSVYTVDPYYSKKRPFSKFTTFYQSLFPITNLSHSIHPQIDFSHTHYQTLVMATPIYFCYQFASCFPRAEIYFIEDGTGSYCGNVCEEMCTSSLRILYDVFKKGPLSIHPSRLYVNNPSMCQSTVANKILPMPHWDAADTCFTELVWNIFGDVTAPLSNTDLPNLIYLQQPLQHLFSKQGDFLQTEKQVLNLIKESSVPFCVRVHPREKSDFYNRFPLHKSTVLWELICAQHISDQNILVGAFSSAQMTPKLLFDKEPYLIFTYKLFPQNILSQESKAVQLSSLISDSYRAKNKIYIPDTLEDLAILIDQLSIHGRCGQSQKGS